MKPLSTIAEAREFGCTHVELICSACNRSLAYSLDLLERRSSQTLEQARQSFRCKRCGDRPDQAYFLNPYPDRTDFEYGVFIWNEARTSVEQVAFAAQSLIEAEPAFKSVSKRYPHRWVTLVSRDALIRDSYKPEFVFDG
jgi:hypothetical protein